jgi:hypothetical protein
MNSIRVVEIDYSGAVQALCLRRLTKLWRQSVSVAENNLTAVIEMDNCREFKREPDENGWNRLQQSI